MALHVEAKSDKDWEVELVDEDRAIGGMIVNELHKNPDVEFASCMVRHPLVDKSPRIVLKTKSKKCKDAFAKALASLVEQVGELKTKVKRIREKKA